ncbi:MAG: hypothetical protein H6822_04865 [Planctomycetaceae bacterium]|nr:hypothetical protein [Planctomycetales bacterium]MCB9921487.1 hypothetical protein [Planctomycetaceae bacterium]
MGRACCHGFCFYQLLAEALVIMDRCACVLLVAAKVLFRGLDLDLKMTCRVVGEGSFREHGAVKYKAFVTISCRRIDDRS